MAQQPRFSEHHPHIAEQLRHGGELYSWKIEKCQEKNTRMECECEKKV